MKPVYVPGYIRIPLLNSTVKLDTNILTFSPYALNRTKETFQLLIMMSNKLQPIFPGHLPLLCGGEEEVNFVTIITKTTKAEAQ